MAIVTVMPVHVTPTPLLLRRRLLPVASAAASLTPTAASPTAGRSLCHEPLTADEWDLTAGLIARLDDEAIARHFRVPVAAVEAAMTGVVQKTGIRHREALGIWRARAAAYCAGCIPSQRWMQRLKTHCCAEWQAGLTHG